MKKKWMAMLLSVTMLLSLAAPSALAAEKNVYTQARENGKVFTAEKLSNPTTGEREADGLESDPTRMNSYAWCMDRMTDEYGDYVYMGTNRNILYASVATGAVIDVEGGDMTAEEKDRFVKSLVQMVSNDEIFSDCTTDEFAQAVIVRYDLKNDKIETWFAPQDYPLVGADGIHMENRYFAYVSAFRVIQNFKGQLYINATVTDPMQPGVEGTVFYRINGNNATTPEIVFTDFSSGTLLRAMTVSADGTKMYFGGITNEKIEDLDTEWQMVIYETETGEEGSFNKIADASEKIFLPYEKDAVPANADITVEGCYDTYLATGGNVWDLVEYHNELYMTLMTNYGCMIFKAHKDVGDPAANEYGWVWSELVGENEGTPYGPGFGNIANYAFTPIIFDDDLYFIGFTNAFDPVVYAMMGLLGYLYPAEGETADINKFFDSLFLMERSLDNECSMFRLTAEGKVQMVMGDEDKCPDNIEYVAENNAGFNDREYSTTLYTWRAAVYNDKLYIGTFDAYPLFKYVTKLTNGDLLNMSGKEFREQLEYVKAFLELIMAPETAPEPTPEGWEESDSTMEAVKAAAEFYKNQTLGESAALAAGAIPGDDIAEKLREADIDKLIDILVGLQQNADKEAVTAYLAAMLMSVPAAAEKLNQLHGYLAYLQMFCMNPYLYRAIGEVKKMVGSLRDDFKSVNAEGLARYVRISNTLAANDNPGFELYCTQDGIHYETVTLNGFRDEYNYGVRTLVPTDDGLLLGTANPFYGAQLWKITDGDETTTDPSQDPDPGHDPAPARSGGSVTTYAVDCGEGVTANKKTAAPGATVTLTVENGYAVPVVKDGDGNVIEVKENGGKYTFKMPESGVTVSLVCPRDDTCPLAKFTDVDLNEWYHDGAHFCVASGLMKGVADAAFAPAATTTRGMIMTMLARLSGAEIDATGEQWYLPGMEWAVANAVSDGTMPESSITREQFATMLYRYAQGQGKGFIGSWMFLLDFNDAASISDWANEAMHWCVMKGILNGKGDKMLDPQGEATRAEVAAMTQRFCENILGK